MRDRILSPYLLYHQSPCSFHEQRSLAERISSEQGIDIQILLGHRSKAIREHYNDTRGKEWVKLAGKRPVLQRSFAEEIKNDNPQRT